MGKHLVLVGGGHAHVPILHSLARVTDGGHRCTLVTPSPYHYYSGMGPGMLAGIYRAQEGRFNVQKLAEDRGATFIQDKVTGVNPERRVLALGCGEEVGYDVVSFNTGSETVMEGLGAEGDSTVYPVKPVENLLRGRRAILEGTRGGDRRVLVVGGGAAGVELAGAVWRLLGENGLEGEITVAAGQRLLSGFSEKASRLALESLSGRGIHILEGVRVERMGGGEAVLADETALAYDAAFLAVGVRPSRIFRDSGLVTGHDGGLLVNRFLQSVRHPEIFGGGDCIQLEGEEALRVGVYAVRQSPVLRDNLRAALEGGELRPFEKLGAYMLILSMGDGRGILSRKRHVCHGRTAFLLKDWIDRRFMRRYQVSGERQEVTE